MLIRRVGDRGPLGMGANECKLPKAPSIDVIVTGLLIPGVNGRERARHRYLLDEASLCAVKPEAGRSALHLPGRGHQPVTPRIGRFEEGASQSK